jgi:catechol 2,3-dioxygenase-like lactoylglutathione lyase family enzyme
MIKAVHHAQVSIPVGAEETARAFYCGILGLIEIPKPEALAGRGGFWVELGEFQIHFGTEDRIERERTKAHVAYLVLDLDSWREKLEANGIIAVDGIPIPDYRRFEFRDPFGNRVEFLERLEIATENTENI